MGNIVEDARERETWNGPFDPETYAESRRILEADRNRVKNEIRQLGKGRWRIVLVVAVVWAACTAALGIVNSDFLLIAEIGWVAVVAWAVFWVLPSFIGRANVDDVYDQYAAQLDRLESLGIGMPEPSSIEDLIAAIDLVSPPEE